MLRPMTDAPAATTGHTCIQGYLKTLDTSPGVYRMLDAQARVLYVGKARNLRARVSNYARPSGHSPRIARMIRETASMMFLTTKTETEALLLEQNLIKQLKPRYNVLLRDDKSFPNILVSGEHAFPQIKKHRGAKKEKGSYYGPFASAGAVNRTLNQLQKVFQLRNCSDATFDSRTRPCLLYQIKRCSAPCVGKISAADYAASVKDAERFLSGRSTGIQEKLAKDMAEASEALEFERAAALRDRIRALTQVQSAQGINPRGVAEADVMALHMEGGQACVQVFFIRANQNWGNRDYYPRVGTDVDTAEVMEALRHPILRYEGTAAPRVAVSRCGQRGSGDRGAGAKGGPEGRDRRAPAGRKGRACVWRRPQRPRKPRPQDGRDGDAVANCSKVWQRPSIWTPRPSGSRSTTTPISKAPMP